MYSQTCVNIHLPIKTILYIKATLITLHWLNKTKKPPNKDHLFIKTKICLSFGWPLFTGLTVYTIIMLREMLQENYFAAAIVTCPNLFPRMCIMIYKLQLFCRQHPIFIFNCNFTANCISKVNTLICKCAIFYFR